MHLQEASLESIELWPGQKTAHKELVVQQKDTDPFEGTNPPTKTLVAPVFLRSRLASQKNLEECSHGTQIKQELDIPSIETEFNKRPFIHCTVITLDTLP
ncbi:unnamed protein product [Lepeophtheirus salmonis]|uniref:(salmon louse) hypothetical protein n=1 Tax=Lepeophtheirus salmonis TaxID=72036 RepID=A0A7R8CGE5_LEPSM|nr:unnamed protein product [Lepeophtheirus salmonis]CAF2809213.1 unnamed protein product [Lepeophtheirus salmonis]